MTLVMKVPTLVKKKRQLQMAVNNPWIVLIASATVLSLQDTSPQSTQVYWTRIKFGDASPNPTAPPKKYRLDCKLKSTHAQGSGES